MSTKFGGSKTYHFLLVLIILAELISFCHYTLTLIIRLSVTHHLYYPSFGRVGFCVYQFPEENWCIALSQKKMNHLNCGLSCDIASTRVCTSLATSEKCIKESCLVYF